jgi:hypothetical protein
MMFSHAGGGQKLEKFSNCCGKFLNFFVSICAPLFLPEKRKCLGVAFICLDALRGG